MCTTHTVSQKPTDETPSASTSMTSHNLSISSKTTGLIALEDHADRQTDTTIMRLHCRSPVYDTPIKYIEQKHSSSGISCEHGRKSSVSDLQRLDKGKAARLTSLATDLFLVFLLFLLLSRRSGSLGGLLLLLLVLALETRVPRDGALEDLQYLFIGDLLVRLVLGEVGLRRCGEYCDTILGYCCEWSVSSLQ